MVTRCTSADAFFTLTYARGGNPFSSNLTLKNFNLNFGIGTQSSSLDTEILYNGCGNYADTPPTLPTIGRAMTFTCNSLTFGGIVNSSSYSTSSGGYIFKLSLKDPKEILDNVTVLYKKYYCSIPSFANFINVMPALEAGVAVCPPGADSENWPRVGSCGTFGTSGLPGYSPDNGVHLLKVLYALNGAVVYTTCGEPLYLDLSFLVGLVYTTAFYAKLDGESQSLSSIIDQACQQTSSDYFVILDGITIRVVLINRAIQPQLGVISSIISSARQSGTLVSSDEGAQEIYEQSNKVIIGDNVSYLAEVDGSSKPIGLFLGFDSKGNPQRAYGENFKVTIDTRPLKYNLGIDVPDDFMITEEEMLCSGSLSMWTLYGLEVNKNSLSAAILNELGLNNSFADALDGFRTLMQDGNDVASWKKAMTKISRMPSYGIKEVRMNLYEQAYGWFDSYVNEWYGRKFLLPVNNFCAYPSSNVLVVPGDTGQFYLSDIPDEAGYPSPSQISNGIKGLSYGSDTYILEGSDRKIQGFVGINMNQNFKKKINGKQVDFRISLRDMDASAFFTKNNILYVTGAADKTVFKNPNTGFPEVIFTSDTKLATIPYFGQERLYLLNKGMRAFTTLFGTEKYDELSKKDKGFSDVSSFNILSLKTGTSLIEFGVVPMRSNVYIYGPYAATKGAIGSTTVTVDQSLNPWNYGGYQGLNLVGSALAANGLRITNISENGSFTLAEPPGYTIDYFLQAGIMIDNIGLTYDGSSGVTTTYSFKTFTAKFADYGQQLASMIRDNVNIRNNILGNINQQRKKAISDRNIASARISNVLSEQLFNEFVNDMASPGFLIVGGYYDSKSENNNGAGGFPNLQIVPQNPLSCKQICEWQPKPGSPPGDGQESKSKLYEIGLNTKKEIESGAEKGENFKHAAIMSLDGLLSPVSIEGRGGRLSPYALVTDSPKDRLGEGNVLTKSRPSMPPVFKDQGTQRLPINQKYLNPVLSTALLREWGGRGISSEGFNIQYVSWGDDVAKLANEERNQETDFGFSALRGPLVLQAWGYDTENKPVPNIIDSPYRAERGLFEDKGTKNDFMKNWLSNPKTWPVGPIDLRWDRDRGVWVCPPPDRIVVAQLLDDLPAYGAADAVLLNPTSGDGAFYENYGVYGPRGENLLQDIKSEKIRVADFLGRSLCRETVVYAAFNDGKYIVLESSFVNDEDCTCDCETTESESPPCEDICGIGHCLSEAFEGPGVLGLDDNGCLTLYELTKCEDEEEEECGTCVWGWNTDSWGAGDECTNGCICTGQPNYIPPDPSQSYFVDGTCVSPSP
jgi:hypothetical protein